ncbi:MAG: FG-GAP repeat protein [Planctomycetota bacterium]
MTEFAPGAVSAKLPAKLEPRASSHLDGSWGTIASVRTRRVRAGRWEGLASAATGRATRARNRPFCACLRGVSCWARRVRGAARIQLTAASFTPRASAVTTLSCSHEKGPEMGVVNCSVALPTTRRASAQVSRLIALSALIFAALTLQPELSGQAVNERPLDAVSDGLSADDWSSIRQAHDAVRHAATPLSGGFAARNPGQQWTTHFDGRGFTVQPDAGGWAWGLQLESYGFAGQERAIAGAAQVAADGERVAYDWDATVQEWYVNDARGLEHGYTVRQQPPQDREGPLTFTLAVRGDLAAQVQADGRGVQFVNGDGAVGVTYAGLTVFDADSRKLPARFEPVATGLLLTIDERGARYPLTIDPIAQQAFLQASNTGAQDRFGESVSVSGNTVVVGASREDSNATGVDGDGSNNSSFDSGAAYVFVRSGASWSQQAYLKASNTGSGDAFGCSVSVSGDTLVVGAKGEESSATGVNGSQANGAPDAGAAYVFVRSGVTWSQQAYLKASNTFTDDRFGGSVSISGDTIVVGAVFEDSNTTGVNGNQGNDSSTTAGAAYVFVRSGVTWSQQAYLKASNTGSEDAFGVSVSVSDDTLVVGASGEDNSATGVNGGQIDNSASGAGAAYVFVRSGTMWSQQAYLKASNTSAGDIFGYSVSVDGDTIVVGAAFEDSNATGVDGDTIDNSSQDSGAAYVFARSGANWSQQAYLKASNTDPNDRFGTSVSVAGDTTVVGAWSEASVATGVDGDQGDNSAPQSGAVYVFVRGGANWSQAAYVKASNTGTADRFGESVSLSGEVVVAGAYDEDTGGFTSGAAYVFDLDNIPWADLGFALAGVIGDPSLVGTGPLTTGSSGALTLSQAASSANAILFLSLASTPSPFKCGTLVPVPLAFQFSLNTDGGGGIPLAWPSWPSGLSGLSLYFQYAIQDAAAVCGVALSNALRADVP